MNARTAIDKHLKEATKLALAEVERLARTAMAKHPNLVEFVMAMGSAFFIDKKGDQVGLDDRGYLKTLDEFIMDYNDEFHITGWPMRFTGSGPVVTDW